MSSSNESDHVPSPPYGHGDQSFQAAGGVEGITKLVECFYAQMDRRADAQRIRMMHPDDLAISKDKLARFLCGWLGGPKRYQEVYGPIRIPAAHARFPIAQPERDAWLRCMDDALAQQPYAEAFKEYLRGAFAVPAERIRKASAAFHGEEPA